MKKTICLNMIVRNESKVLERCLESVKPFISHWVIVDTGSTDGTQMLIKNMLIDIPGELYERPWVDFAYNRNQALALAKDKADYLLFIDADDLLKCVHNEVFASLEKDYYSVVSQDETTSCSKILLVNTELAWHWEGVLHEALNTPFARTQGFLDDVIVLHNASKDSFRSQNPQKYQQDAELLKELLKKEPDNTRYQFFLGQSYHNAKEYPLALKAYEQRVKMGGSEEEIYWSMLHIGILQELLEMSPNEVVNSYYAAYQFRPSRSESLYYLTRYFRKIGNLDASYEIAFKGIPILHPDDEGFIAGWIYDYGMLVEFAAAAYLVKRYNEAEITIHFLLQRKALPAEVRTNIMNNLKLIQLQKYAQGIVHKKTSAK